jgi:hypothetical protein
MIDNQFSVPFHLYSVDDWINNKKIILDSLPDFKNYKLKKSKNSAHGDKNHYSDYFDNLKKPPEYSKCVLNVLDKYIKLFCDHTKESWNLNAIWFQSYETYNNFQVHNHGIGGWSAVFYVEFDDKEHSPTTFYCPYMSSKRSMLGGYDTYIPKVKEGDLIIFPSFILHEASSNMSDKRRTIISFNLK